MNLDSGQAEMDEECMISACQAKGNKRNQPRDFDVSKRRNHSQAEQRRRAQRMESLGLLAAGVAHDFNNLLGVILGYCEILAEQESLPQSTREMIAEMQKAGMSARDMTQGLLAFSGRQVLQPVALNLNESIRSTETILGRMIGDQVQLVSVLAESLGTIRADPGQLEQVLMNLAINARDAMPNGGRIRIETANVAIDETGAGRRTGSSAGKAPGAGQYVLLTVSDEGVGLDPATQDRIFEPFFSTKSCGLGTGIGLSTVAGIVKQSGGTIAVESAPGEGTSVLIYFRCCDQTQAVKSQTKAQLNGGRETILLVEDALPLRALTRRMLEECGYKVVDSGDPVEALRLAGEIAGALPLMITDVVMPGCSGIDLAQKLSVFRPETRVLYASGYSVDLSTCAQGCGQESAFLAKPFTREDLLKRVRDLLDSPIQRHPPMVVNSMLSTALRCG